MALSLPGNADLEHLRRDARRLQRGVRSGDARALELAARHHPAGPPDDLSTYALSDAQLVVARAYGFASWPRLVAYLRVAASLSRDPAALDPAVLDPAVLDPGAPDPGASDPDGSATESASLVAALACLTYTERDEPARWHRAAELLSAQPELVNRDVSVAAAAGDGEALRVHLAADPSAVEREGGPFGWVPLLYVVYSRLPQRAPVDSARLLLDAGADPDSGYLWQGLPTPFTALTGAFGEGENGPCRQPRHPRWRELAELLLERGADPNDRQTLYNRMFGRDDSHLELLLRHGLGRPASEVWARRIGVTAETIDEMLARQVDWALDHGYTHRLELLARHGLVDPATMSAAEDTAEGAAEDAAEGAADGAASGPRRSGQVRTEARIARLSTPEAVREAAARGDDLEARREGRTALHQAAFMGDVELVRALLDAGADPEARDDVHRTRPLEWARWARAEDTVRVLEGVTADSADSADPADPADNADRADTPGWPDEPGPP